MLWYHSVIFILLVILKNFYNEEISLMVRSVDLYIILKVPTLNLKSDRCIIVSIKKNVLKMYMHTRKMHEVIRSFSG